MKIKYYIFIVVLVLLLTLGFSYPKLIKEDIKAEENIDSKFDIPKKSSCVKNLPWENDKEFLKAMEKNNSKTLVAGYCAVLTDPLPGEEYNVDLASKTLKGIVVQPNKVFSQNESIGPYTEERGYKKGASFAGANIVQTEGGGVCKIATTLYNTAIYSNLEIVERHNHTMPVNYVPYGQDATVAYYGYKDFKFKNNREFPILIWSKFMDNKLYVGFYGQEGSPEVEWKHKITNKVEASKDYIDNPDLKKGEEKIIRNGIDGAKVESSIIIKHKDGKTETKDRGISLYAPMPYIIETNKVN